MIVAALFTINFYGTKEKEALNMDVVKKTVGLNLQAMVIISDRNPSAGQDTIGVHDLPPCADVEEDLTVTVGRACRPDYVAVETAPVPSDVIEGEEMA